MDDDVITIEDAEKCLTFYSPTVAQSTITNEKGIREWYDHIQSGIQHMQKKHRLCGICNRNCEYSPSIDNAVQMEGGLPELKNGSETGKESLKCIICRGCGRSICLNCIPCMKADPLQDAVDKTLYCLHCRNWNRREIEMSGENYQVVVDENEAEWHRVVNDQNQPQFWYNEKKEVSWKEPVISDMYDESSFCDEKVMSRKAMHNEVNWLRYTSKDDRDYYYNCETNQVQWKQTMDVVMNTRIENNVCLNCGHEMKNWAVVCPRCQHKWSVYRCLSRNTPITQRLPVKKHPNYAKASRRIAVTNSSRAMICVVHVLQSAPLNSL